MFLLIDEAFGGNIGEELLESADASFEVLFGRFGDDDLGEDAGVGLDDLAKDQVGGGAAPAGAAFRAVVEDLGTGERVAPGDVVVRRGVAAGGHEPEFNFGVGPRAALDDVQAIFVEPGEVGPAEDVVLCRVPPRVAVGSVDDRVAS